MPEVTFVKKGSYAWRKGIRAGDEMLLLNGEKITDTLDLLALDGEEKFSVTMQKKGKTKTVTLKKDAYGELDFSLNLIITPRQCRNHCMFCFIEQLPKGMRDSLYIKDDDYRMSMICGSYITLTNLTDEDIARILRLHISPLYVSFHAATDSVRRRLLGNKDADKMKGIVELLNAHGIILNMQIVLVEGENSGEELEKTLTYLCSLENVVSLAIVPVGLTCHREKLYKLNPVSKECALETIEKAERFNKMKGGVVWCSDEMYIIAGKELPPFESYGEFDQIENGVGLVRTFEREVDEALSFLDETDNPQSYALVTGISFSPFLKDYVDRIRKKVKGLTANVYTVENKFFGSSVTVAGLLTGGDIINAIKDDICEKNLIIPKNMLREFTDTFLDGTTVPEMEKALGVKVFVSSGGGDLVDILSGEREE